MTTIVPVSQVTNLRVTKLAPTHITLAWKAPAKGTPPIKYTVYFRKMGVAQWSVGATGTVTFASVTGLKPATEYEFEIFAHNW